MRVRFAGSCDCSLPKFVFSGHWGLFGIYFDLSGPKVDQNSFDRVNLSRHLSPAGSPLVFAWVFSVRGGYRLTLSVSSTFFVTLFRMFSRR